MRAARVDANQSAIVEALRKAGATVALLHKVGGGVPDIIAGFRGCNYLLEIKTKSKASKLNDTQLNWHSMWKGQVAVVRDVDDALRAIGFFS